MRNYTYNADFLEKWFRSSGVTLTQLMKDLNVNNTSLKRWMTDKSNPLPVEKMVLLCNIYDIDLSEFFFEDGRPAHIRRQRSRETGSPPHGQPAPPAITKEELLQLKLDHLQEVQRIQKDAREREDAIRKDYEQRIEEYKQMVREGMQSVRIALSKIGPGGGVCAGDCSSDGDGIPCGAFPAQGPLPHVSPKNG